MSDDVVTVQGRYFKRDKTLGACKGCPAKTQDLCPTLFRAHNCAGHTWVELNFTDLVRLRVKEAAHEPR